MPYTSTPAGELQARLDALRAALSAADPDWQMVLIDHKINLFYLTGSMQEGILVLTPQQAVYYVRRVFSRAKQESTLPDIRPMRSPRTIAEDFCVPSTVYLETRTLTLDTLSRLQKYLPFTVYRSVNGIVNALRSIKSPYELACMRRAGEIQKTVLEEIVPTLLQRGMTEAELCMDTCRALIERGAMGISRFNQPFAEDVLGVVSFGEDGLLSNALDSPSGTLGTSIAMRSIGSAQVTLTEGMPVLLDIPSGFCGYHTDKSICYYFGALGSDARSAQIRSAYEQCHTLLDRAVSLMTDGAVPSQIYETICSEVAPAFTDGFMNTCKFLGHSIGLTMDETPVLARGFDAPLRAGMTIAVEPKIALPGIGLIGVENTYEILPSGPAQPLNGTGRVPFSIY